MEEEDKELLGLLDVLESSLKRRIVRAPLRSPETLFEELDALDLVVGLKTKLGH